VDFEIPVSPFKQWQIPLQAGYNDINFHSRVDGGFDARRV
jgi:hypothetical protein